MIGTLYLIIAAGLLAILYGYIVGKQILLASPGNKKMQDIAAAIQEGARAYLNRQYKTIAIVGLIILVIISFFSLVLILYLSPSLSIFLLMVVSFYLFFLYHFFFLFFFYLLFSSILLVFVRWVRPERFLVRHIIASSIFSNFSSFLFCIDFCLFH